MVHIWSFQLYALTLHIKKDPVFKITYFFTKYLCWYFTDKMICDQPNLSRMSLTIMIMSCQLGICYKLNCIFLRNIGNFKSLTSQYDFIGKKSLYGCNKVKMRSLKRPYTIMTGMNIGKKNQHTKTFTLGAEPLKIRLE